MKKVISIVMSMALICVMLTGCMVEENYITINSDGSGSLKTTLYVEEEMRELFEDAQGETEFNLEKVIDEVKYVGMQDTQNFSNIDMLKQTLKYNDSSSLISRFDIKTTYENGNQVATLTFVMVDKVTFDKQFGYYDDTDTGVSVTNDGEISLSNSIKASLEVVFPGEIIESSGNSTVMTVSGKTVHFNLVPQETEEEFTVKGILRTGVTPGVNHIDDKFPMTRLYNGEFTDVPADAWYLEALTRAYNTGIISGTSDTTFNPSGEVTVAQAIVMAARVRSIYNGDNHTFTKINESDNWYQPYIDYAVDQGIIWDTDYEDKFDNAATRGDMAYIFANTLPSSEYTEINDVTAIPDVSELSDLHAYVMRLYKAGISQGSDNKGTFNPNNNISRAETAVIITRVALSSTRVTFNLQY